MERTINTVHIILKWVLVSLMSLMVIDVIWQVFTRFILRYPSSITEELASFLLIWVGLLGSAYALQEKAHLGIDLITNRLNTKNKLISQLLTYCIVMIVAFVVFVIGGLRIVYITLKLDQISPALQIKMGYIYLVIPVSGILMVFYAFGWIFQSVSKLKNS